jgi:hypothetical protein
MRWEDERYVRLYTRDSADWMALPWEARAVFYELLRKVDRAGILPVGKSGLRGVAGIFHMPVDVVESGVAALAADGCVQRSPEAITIPNFLAAQESRQTDAARKRSQRERDIARAIEEKNSNDYEVIDSFAVTRGHARSPEVTPCLAVPSLAKPSQEEDPENSPPAETPSEPSGSGPCSSNPEGPSSQTSQRSAEEPQEPAPLRNGHPAQVALLALDAAPSRPPRESPAEVVWARYLECWRQHVRGGRPPVFTPKRKKLVAARLKDGLLLEDLLGAVTGIWRSQWHVEEGHTEFDLCLRDVTHVEKYRDMKATNGRALPGVSTLQPKSTCWEARED